MTNQSQNLESIKKWLVTHAGCQNPEIKLLLGDGSTRCFYRIKSKDSNESWILISDPQWVQTQDYPAHQKALKEIGISVPEFFQVDKDSGFLLMQDLGDTLLQSVIVESPNETLQWLTRATQILSDLHGKLYPVPNHLPVSARAFDSAKFFEELSFTQEHLRKQYLNLPALTPSQLKAVKSFCDELGHLTPKVFCHRDYHCRNILVRNHSLWVIDFQDARLGPPEYDLASLLFDAYVPISEETRKKLVATYQDGLKQFFLYKEINWELFEKQLYQIAYQRTLKAAGSFASFWTRYKKDSHLKYILPALKLAKEVERRASIPLELVDAFQIDTMLGLLHAKASNN